MAGDLCLASVVSAVAVNLSVIYSTRNNSQSKIVKGFCFKHVMAYIGTTTTKEKETQCQTTQRHDTREHLQHSNLYNA